MGSKASKCSVRHVPVVDIIATGKYTNSTNEGKEDTINYNRDDRDIHTDSDVDDGANDVHIGRLICVDPLEGGPMLIPVREFIICDDFQQFH